MIDLNTDELLGSATTDANGFYSISGIPSGAQTNVAILEGNGFLYKINEFTFQQVFVESDTLLENRNMFTYSPDWIVPQTVNDPAPATTTIDPDLIDQLVGNDDKNAEEFLRDEKRMFLTNFGSSADSAYAFAVETTIDSLFYSGQGSSIVFVPNQVNITTYHQHNYNHQVGFPGELGYNVTRGGGNNTALTHSTVTTGYFILGGTIHITGGVNNLESAIKEWLGRAEDMGDTDVAGMMYAGTTTMPNLTERAYHRMSNINLTGRFDTDYEVFSLKGLSTTSKAPNKLVKPKQNTSARIPKY